LSPWILWEERFDKLDAEVEFLKIAMPEGRVMLTQITETVLVHQSDFLQTKAVIVRGPTGVLLVDPGIHG
jgi:hypothetical protein